jgi:uncharacterized membrane protein YkvA (DUF1232 family)
MRIPGFLLYQGFRRGLRNPQIRPWLFMGIFVYLLSPIDLVPSFLPGLGEIDDVMLIGLLLTELLQMWAGDPFAPAKPQTQVDPPSPSHVVVDVQADVVGD